MADQMAGRVVLESLEAAGLAGSLQQVEKLPLRAGNAVLDHIDAMIAKQRRCSGSGDAPRRIIYGLGGMI